LSGDQSAQFRCPQCGYLAPSNDDLAPDAFFRPWHVLHGRLAVKSYVASLGRAAHEWLLALYVDVELQLLAVDTVAQGDVSSCDIPTWHLISRGKALGAAGFILVHNHPSGDARASQSDIQSTCRLAHVARELDVPLLDHLVIAGDDMTSVGYW
jgi:DNA repair protein RadC